MEYSDPEKHTILFTINNQSGRKEEIDKYRDRLVELIEKRFIKFDIPASWFMLSMLLKLFASKKNRCTISVEECHDIGKRLGMREEMVEYALEFFHKYIGIVMYFRDIDDEHLKHHVICSPQVIFKSISELIFKVYTVSRDVACGPCPYEELKKTGKFSLKDIQKEDKADLLPVESLVKLLVHLNIAAPITEDDCYILPAVLKTSLLDSQITEAAQYFLVQFKSGFVPLGVFCALMAKLVSTDTNNFLLLQPKDGSNGDEYIVTKNNVTFRVFGKYNVTLMSWLKYIEIRVSHLPEPHAIDGVTTTASAGYAKSLSEICPYVRKTVCEALDNVISTMKKKPSSEVLKRDYSLGFRCSNHSSASPGHEPLALVQSDQYVPASAKVPSKVDCATCQKSMDLSEGMNDWFRHREVKINNSYNSELG